MLQFIATIPYLDSLYPVCLLALFWLWETWAPLFRWQQSRVKHAVHNLLITFLNKAVMAVCFSALTVSFANAAGIRSIGLLNNITLPDGFEIILGLLFLDAWMYIWHRANHVIPFLWSFHRTHHSDNHMDVTSATRFHLGEHLISATLRLVLILLLGLSVWHLVIYHALMVFTTQFHHANISLGRFDQWIRLVIVSPDMHKVHHSREQIETDSNYAVVLSIWDRLGRSFRLREDPKTIEFGLDDYDEPKWQTVWGMLKTPWRKK
ncbi:MAG: fatty acid hydroxylase [Blastopirellula sp.]|nr:MAG: fatty acid hydroxylase [Blastopirellula sp.]